MKYLYSIALVLILFCVEDARACSCSLPEGSLKQQVSTAKKEASSVFVGKIVNVTFSKEQIGDTPSSRYAEFEIQRSWKGTNTKHVTVGTGNVCCICGVTFKVGEIYLVYAYQGDDGTLSTNICSRTTKIEKTSPDERFLGKKLK